MWEDDRDTIKFILITIFISYLDHDYLILQNNLLKLYVNAGKIFLNI